MKMLDLFSGIGGFHLAAEWVWGEELEVVAHCEIEPFCQKVLKKHWPDVPIHDDIKTLKGDSFGTIDLITGGFPCQPFSVAGKQGGKEDDRYLWPEMLRVISEAKPTWILGENVAGIVQMELDAVLADLEGEGYEVQTLIIPACATDAPHRRDRVWIVANARHRSRGNQQQVETRRNTQAEWCGYNSETCGSSMLRPPLANNDRVRVTNEQKNPGFELPCKNVSYPINDGSYRKKRNASEPGSNREKNGLFVGGRTWAVEPGMGRVANGIPNRVDRLKGLGNAIVPQVAAEIMQTIKQV